MVDWLVVLGIVGSLASLLSLGLTIPSAREASQAAAQAKVDAGKVREILRRAGLVEDIGTVVGLLVSLQQMHRQGGPINWERALDRYTEVRGRLVRIKSSDVKAVSGYRATLTNALADLSDMRHDVDAALPSGRDALAKLDYVRYNDSMNSWVEILDELAAKVRQEMGE